MFEKQTKKLREAVEAAWPELDVVIGWGTGFDSLHMAPLFVRRPEDISRLMWTPLCVQNLTGYLAKTPALQPAEGKKIGICVKGCDSRSLVALLQEKFISRDKVMVFGLPCSGTVDWRKVMKELPLKGVVSAVVDGGKLRVTDASGDHELPLEKALARRCLRCRVPNPVIQDLMVGEAVTPRGSAETAYSDVAAVEAKPLSGRMAFWQEQLDRCIRCYACRNACPLCVCQDKCVAETRDPKWLSQYVGLSEKFMFHFIHALHLAGRCTECGECERVCPMEIPVTLMKEKLCQVVRDRLEYEAGLNEEAVPPLLTFNPSETGL